MHPVLKNDKIEGVEANFLEFQNGIVIVKTLVFGKIINSITENKEASLQWKQVIAKLVHDETTEPHSPEDCYAVSLNMRFNSHNHKRQRLDVENFVKPIMDGIAMGLFSNDSDFSIVKKFDKDDSNFNYLYIERLSDVSEPIDESVVIIVSKTKNISNLHQI